MKRVGRDRPAVEGGQVLGTLPRHHVARERIDHELVLLYEIHTIDRFRSVGDFLSYSRLVTPKQTSDGKVTGQGGNKIGNVHMRWAFSEAALMMLRYSDDAKAFLKRKQKKHGKGRAMTMLARKISRTVYHILKREEAFDEVKFFAS